MLLHFNQVHNTITSFKYDPSYYAMELFAITNNQPLLLQCFGHCHLVALFNGILVPHNSKGLF